MRNSITSPPSSSEVEPQRQRCHRPAELEQIDVGVVVGIGNLADQGGAGPNHVAQPAAHIGLLVFAVDQEERLGAAVFAIFETRIGERGDTSAEAELSAELGADRDVAELRYALGDFVFASAVDRAEKRRGIFTRKGVREVRADDLAIGVADALGGVAQLRVLGIQGREAALAEAVLVLQLPALGIAVASPIEIE